MFSLTANNFNSYFASVGPRVAAKVQAQNAPTDLNVHLPRIGACGFQPREIALDELSGRFQHALLGCLWHRQHLHSHTESQVKAWNIP